MKLLVYSDGHPSAVKALQFAAQLAHKLDGDMAVITVRSGTDATEPLPPFGQDVDLTQRQLLPSGLQILADALDVLFDQEVLDQRDKGPVRMSELPNGHLFVCRSGSGKRIPFYVCFGPMIETLNQEIDRHQYDLLVIAPPQRGRVHKMVLGDTTRKLALNLHTSVLIVRGGRAESRFVVCVDGSPASRRQSAMLKHFLPAIGPPVELVWVRAPDSDAAAIEMAARCLERARQWMADGGKQYKIHQLEGERPAEVICSLAGEDAVIFLGASLRHDVYRRLMGSLPIQILARTVASVLVVKGLPEEEPEFKAAFQPVE